MGKRKYAVDKSFIGLLREMKFVDEELGMEYYFKPINRFASFVIEIGIESGFIDISINSIGSYSDCFLEEYKKLSKSFKTFFFQSKKEIGSEKKLLSAIRVINDFSETYKDSNICYAELNDIIKLMFSPVSETGQ